MWRGHIWEGGAGMGEPSGWKLSIWCGCRPAAGGAPLPATMLRPYGLGSSLAWGVGKHGPTPASTIRIRVRVKVRVIVGVMNRSQLGL